ncbi:TonB-dependent receptor plug domain-containing protein [Alteromonas macleodii]|uniref:Ferric-rhodotorulic acid transporter n=1 Tax=Alteromonas macleodii TaxID=28108 RepID=A0A6T9Y7C4_ALTMA|nr:TonB-dependent receptor [Alteromonas macleodii]CAB9495226.1 Ferric-rhodotorulic acid transporter [Alteromonas macleodii]
MKRVHFLPSLLVAASFPLAFSVLAEGDLERVVVTGTRTPKLLASSPVKVDVVDKEDIARLSKGTLRQVLEVMPGVVVRRSQKDGYNVQLNGFNGDHVLVLINGQPIISPTGSSVDLDQISVANIKQIEIVRGAASVLYGSSAMGGVINIITEKVEGSQFSADYEASYFTNDAIDGDEFGHTSRVTAAKAVSNWQLGITAQNITNPGFDYDNETTSQDGGAVDKSFVQMSLSTLINNISVQYKGQWLDEQKNKPQSSIPGQATIISYLSNVTQWQHDVRVEQQYDWHINTRYLSHNEESGNSNGLRQTDIQLAELEAQKIYSTKDIEWVGGLVLHGDTLDQQNLSTGTVEVDDVSRESAELYLQGNWQKNDTQLLAGARIQNDSDFGWHTAFKASASQSFSAGSTSWQLRAGAGSSYRVPNLKERYYIFDHSNLGYMVLGNDALTPETALNANLGANLRVEPTQSDWLYHLDINLHYTKADDFINTAVDVDASQEAGLDISVYQNLDEATLYGADLSASAQNDNWQWQLNYSYLIAEDGSSQRLPERPTHLVKASVTYQFSQTDTSLQLYGVHEGNVSPSSGYITIAKDSFTTLNAVVQQQFTPKWQARLGLENLTDEHRSSDALVAGAFDARPIAARRLYLGVSYQY